VQERGLHAEDQVLLGAAQVEEAPVEAHVDAAVGGDRVVGQRLRDDLDLLDLDLDAAELPWVSSLMVVVRGTRMSDRGFSGSGSRSTPPFTSCTAPLSSRSTTNCT
jgi:hypothetical protein